MTTATPRWVDLEIVDGWPKWATVRAEEVRTVVSENQRGPWSQSSSCARGTPPVYGLDDTRHPSEPPYFFHCVSCIEINRSAERPRRPNQNRDHGLCVKCGERSALSEMVHSIPKVIARTAEANGVTFARLCTRMFCASCDPYSLPMCTARVCGNVKRHRGLPRGCCGRTGTSHRPKQAHCKTACDDFAAKKEERAVGTINRRRVVAPALPSDNKRTLVLHPTVASSALSLLVAGGSYNSVAKQIGHSREWVKKVHQNGQLAAMADPGIAV